MDPHWEIWIIGEPFGIGATSTLLRYHHGSGNVTNILLDFGIGFDRGRDGKDIHYVASEDMLAGIEIHVIVLTHAHLDHSGAIPYIARKHPEATILTSRTTLPSATILWQDTLKIQRSDAMRAMRGGTELPPAAFTETDFKAFFEHQGLTLVNDEGEWIFDLRGMDIGLWPNGHLRGSMCVSLVPQDGGTPLFATGDLAFHDQETVRGFRLPGQEFFGEDNIFARRPIVLTEATNGGGEEKARFVADVGRVIAGDGVVFIPTFTLGRIANVATMLIEAGHSVYIDGLAKKFVKNEIPNYSDLILEGKIKLFPDGEDPVSWGQAKGFRRAVARGQHGPAIILAGSATMDQGWASFYAPTVLAEQKNAVYFTGHVFPHTSAEATLRLKGTRGNCVVIPGWRGQISAPVNCEVEHYDFTSHAYGENIADFIIGLNPSAIVAHHGDQEGIFGLREKIAARQSVRIPFIWGSHSSKIQLPA